MTSTNLNCIRKTWSLAALNKMQVALIFYANLFRIAPETEALFKNDLTSQGEKLMDTLVFVVDHLDEPATSYLCSALAEINSSGKILSLSWGGLRQSVLFAARCVRSHSQIGLKPQIQAKHLSARHSSCHPRQRPEIQ